MRNLFEIQEEYLQYLEELEQYFIDNPDSGGEIPEHIDERLNINKNEASSKLTNFYLWRLELEGQIDSLKQRRDQLNTKIKVKQNVIERIKEYINNAVRLYGDVNLKSKGKIPSKVIQGGDVKFTYIYSPVVVIKDINLIPDSFIRYGVDISNMTKREFLALKDYLNSREITATEDSEVNLKALGNALELTKVDGAELNKEAGYVRTN